MILNKKNPQTIQILTSLMHDGATTVIPCDTIYGLCAIVGTGENALKALKGRDASKPFLILATLEQAKDLCSQSIPDDILDCWPGPLTVILNTKDGKTTGIRVPKDEFLQKLLEGLGQPIYSTSVNISGEPSLLNINDICARFESLVDVIVKGPEVQGTTPSTIIDATSKPYKILRQGAFDASSLVANCCK